MDKAEDSVVSWFDVLQPLSAGIVRAWFARTEHDARLAAHIPRMVPIDSATFTVRIETAKSSVGKLNLCEAIVGDILSRAAHNTR
jgi:hypothetical protein